MSRTVVITGMGCVSGLGIGVEENWKRLRDGKGAIGAFDEGGMKGVAAKVDFGTASFLPPSERLHRLGRIDPLSVYALAAANEALEQSGLAGDPVLGERTAIVVGSGSGGNLTIDTAYERLFAKGLPKVHPQTIPSSMLTAPAAHISMMWDVRGPAFSLSSACASSAHALGEAMHMIRSGRADVVIAGGTEACISLGSWTAWHSLGVMAADSCRPFSRDRQGLVLGDGAAMLVLESEDHARARGVRRLGILAGYGSGSDAAHMTAPDVDGMTAAIRRAHADAGTATDVPALISAHGTGTRLNDATEAKALRAVYGTDLDRHCVIATKSAHGHMIGAGGAMEFVVGMKALCEGIAPPVLNYIGSDPDCALPLAQPGQGFVGDMLVSNSFAFGGLNAVLIGTRA